MSELDLYWQKGGTYIIPVEVINQLTGEFEDKDKEIERLNNIINELEKDIKNLYTYGIKNNAEQRDYLLNRLKELRELKGSNSNENL